MIETVIAGLGRTGGDIHNVAAAIRSDAPAIITPESVRETIAVLETCRQQNRSLWGNG